MNKRLRTGLLTGALLAAGLPIAGGTAEAVTYWNCGTVTHAYPAASGSASLSSTVLGCGVKVAIKCTPPLDVNWLVGDLAYTGQTSTKNCAVGKVVSLRGHYLGTGW